VKFQTSQNSPGFLWRKSLVEGSMAGQKKEFSIAIEHGIASSTHRMYNLRINRGQQIGA
jgi:hypothetical protein